MKIENIKMYTSTSTSTKYSSIFHANPNLVKIISVWFTENILGIKSSYLFVSKNGIKYAWKTLRGTLHILLK